MMTKINLKHRYLLTRGGTIRLKYVMGIIALIIVLGTFVKLSMTSEEPNQDTVAGIVVESDVVAPQSLKKVTENVSAIPKTEPAQTIRTITNYDPEVSGHGLAPFYARMGKRPYFDKPYAWTKNITVQSGDVLGLLMEQTGLKGDDYVAATRAMKTELNPQDIRPGHVVRVTTNRLGYKDDIASVAYIYDSLKSVVVSKSTDGKWAAQLKTKPLDVKTYAVKATIETSIYGSLGKAGVPDGIINRMITTYSWTVDFQRDIWGGEAVELLYETKETSDGEYVRSNRLLYANLKLKRKSMPIYLFEKEKGYYNYFEPDGQSIRRTLMRTPVDGARLSSGFGMRKHPVLGYNKMHKGLDFAAPKGTPIYAAGDGVVERANRFGAYGNYMRIRHNETYKTAYAHISKFASGIKKGSRVKQGQVVAYVGNTGRSTGPHLHYEVIKKGKQVNPHSVDLPLGEKLKGKNLTQFKKVVKQRSSEFNKLL